jgi:hypothetical protein
MMKLSDLPSLTTEEALSRLAVFTVEDEDDPKYGRQLVHVMGGFTGAHWYLEDALTKIEQHGAHAIPPGTMITAGHNVLVIEKLGGGRVIPWKFQTKAEFNA